MSTQSLHSKKQPVRRIRICSKSFPRAGKSYVFYPEFRLCGRWLQDNGFLPGQYLRIHVEGDRLVLSRDYEAEALKRRQEAEAARGMQEMNRLQHKKPEPEVKLLSREEMYAVYLQGLRARGLPLPGQPGHPDYYAPRTKVPYATDHGKKSAKGSRKRTG